MDPNHSGGHKIRAEEGHHAAERVPLRPQHRRRRHVAHRADEGKEGDDRRDGGVLKHSEEGEALPAASANEEGVPKDLRDEDGNEPGDREAEENLLPDHLPFHEEGMGDPPPAPAGEQLVVPAPARSEEHTSELQSLMRISYAV